MARDNSDNVDSWMPGSCSHGLSLVAMKGGWRGGKVCEGSM